MIYSTKSFSRIFNRSFLFLILLVSFQTMNAQNCGFVAGDGCSSTNYSNYGYDSSNDPATIEYDNIIATYSSTAVRNASGSYTVWGNNMANSGTGNLTTPQLLNSTNYPALSTHKVLKVTGGSYGSNVQFIALTSDGLYTWGSGRVLNWTLNGAVASFKKVNATNGNNYSLPTGLTPSDVKMLAAGNTGGQYYGALVLVTCSGDVWVLSDQYATEVRGNGNTGNETTWIQVHTSLNNPLTGIVAARIHGNTVMALKNDNTIWTWGTQTYLGDNSLGSDRAYATQMTHPDTSKTIKMIGITGIGGSNNTYYALMTDGNLYAMGSNSSYQLGNWTSNSNIAKTWTQPRYTSSAGPVMNNIKWISPQENDQYYASINVITTTGQLYAWGANTVNMLGLPLAPTDPAAPSGLGTNIVKTVKSGGLFSLIVQEGKSNFGYTGNTIFSNSSTYNFNSTTASVCGAPNPYTAPGGNDTASLWYRADLGITNNSGVQQWDNQASTSYNLVQATATARPAINTTTNLINFNPTVGFDGTSDFLQTPSVPQAVTVASNLSSHYIVYKNKQTGVPYLYSHSDNLGGVFNMGGAGNQMFVSNKISSFTNVGMDEIRLQSVQGNAGGTVESRVNGTSVSTAWNANGIQNVSTVPFNVGGPKGDIAEIIVFPNNTNAANERQKVESYLGLKYGITLPYNYMASDASVYWNTTTNTGYNNNITGLGRDETSKLYQKQSKSINTGDQIVIGVGGALAESNTLNSNTLTDKQFLVVGDNGLAKSLSTNVSGISGINLRFPSIWKVQNTNTVGTVRVMWPQGVPSIKLIQSTDAVFNGTDTVTDMAANTQTIGGIVYNYADVTLTDGQFFTIAGLFASPGGVVGADFWVKTDDVGTIATAWKDHSANNNSIENVGNVTLAAADAAHNFYPYTTGYSSSKFFRENVATFAPTAVNTQRSIGIFSATRPTSLANGRITGIDNEDNTAAEPYLSMTSSGATRFYKYWGNEQGTDGTHLAIANQSALKYWTADNVSKALMIGHNGNENTSTVSGTIGTTGPYLLVGYGTWNLNGAFPGDIMEVIWYNKTLTTNESDRINSYLAIKNGVTFAKNYLSASSATIWDRTINTSYTNNIAGIGRNDSSGLYQKQANSTSTGSQVLIGVGGALANSNALNSNTLNDEQFLIWGDNGLTKSLGTTITGISGINSRFNAIWKVQNTNTVVTVRVMWPQGVANIKLMQSADAIFDASDTVTDMAANTQTINGIVYNYADVTLTNGQFFTFAGAVTYPGGVDGPDFWVKSDDAGTIATAWKDHSANNNPIENVGNVSLTAADAAHNFHPYTTGYSASKYFRDGASVFAPIATYVQRSVGIFSAVRPTSLALGTITGIDNDNLYTGSPSLTMRSTGNTGFYKYWDGTQGYNSTSSVVANYSSLHYFTGNNVSKVLTVGNNGNENTTTISGTLGTWGPVHMLGYGLWDGGVFPGDIMEVVWYNKVLTTDESDRINSYLAIKNGVTFAKNYLSSSSVTVWNRTVNTSYNNNIFGIATDNNGSLSQKVSNSINANSILKVATVNNFTAANADATRTALPDNQFLMIGDNNIHTGTTAVNPVDCPVFSDGLVRINKTWMTQETGTVGKVYVEVDLAAFSINSEISMYLSDNATFSSNSAVATPISVTGSKAVFYIDFKANQYFTIVGKVGASPCATCKGDKLTVRQGNSWDTSAKKINNTTNWFTVGSDGEGTVVQAKNTVTYTTSSNQWVNDWYPAAYGASALMPHVGTTNGAASKMIYKTELNRAAKVSFDLTGISEYYGNKVKVIVKGYCGTDLVSPTITPAISGAYSIYNGYTISGNTVTGNKYYQGLNIFSQVKVNFSKPVERVEIEYTIERTTVYYTHFWFLVGDMSLECDSPLEPNIDNVFIKQSFENDNISACNEAVMKMSIINNNCNERVIDLTNTLPTGLEYVSSSYSGLGTPTYSGQNFNLSALTIPSGTSNLFVKVKSSNAATITASTTYETQSSYVVSIASGGTGDTILSDNLSALSGLQKTNLTLNPGAAPAMPEVTFTSDAVQDACGVVNYTVTIDNNTGNALSGLQMNTFLNMGQIVNGSITLSAGLTGTIVPTPQNGETNYFIPDLAVPTGVHTITFQTQVTQIDEFATNSVELFFDPLTEECALAAKVVANLDQKCPTCEGGKGDFDMNYNWWLGGATARTTNQITNITAGTPQSGMLKADAKVTYPNATTEWLPDYFPRWNGNWTELSRFDNLNGAAGKVFYEVNVKDASGTAIAAKPSFQIAGITKIAGQTDVVSVKGYCGSEEILPKLIQTYNSGSTFWNDYYRRFEIDEVSATATGTKPYYDEWSFATMNVEFEKPVDKIVVEWSVNRTPVNKTLGFLYISDMKLTCDNRPEPNPDNVHVIASYLNEDLPTCEEATLKLNIKNWNCDDKVINLTNTLPASLEYVANSYSGIDMETPTYSGQSFTLNNLTVPSGNSYIYVKVKPTNTAASGAYSTFFNYTVVGGTNSPNPYTSDDDSGTAGLQNTVINYTATAALPKPTLVKEVDKCFTTSTNGDGTELTYTIKVSNPSASAINNAELLELLDGNQEFVAGSLVNPFGGTVNDYATDLNYLHIAAMSIPANTVNGIITFKVKTKDTDVDISNLVSITISPESECGSANKAYSNELLVEYCSDIDTDIDGIPDVIDIDDDNDGVLDTTEMNCEVIKNGTFTQANTGNGAAITNWNVTGNVRVNANTLNFNSSDTTPNAVVYQDVATNIGFPVTINYNVSTIGTNSNMKLRVDLLDVNTNIVLASKTTTNITALVNESIIFEPIGTTTRIRITDLSTATISVDIVLDNVSILYCDTDNDGIPNSLDLDSDNDGCFDAKESGVPEGKFDVATGKVTGAVAANGLADDLETVADSGSINYSNTYIIYAIEASISACLDTDLDGITDIIDIDDDNDGILDTDEGCASENIVLNGDFSSNADYWTSFGFDNFNGKAVYTSDADNVDNPDGQLSQTVTGIQSNIDVNGYIPLSFKYKHINNVTPPLILTVYLNGTLFTTIFTPNTANTAASVTAENGSIVNVTSIPSNVDTQVNVLIPAAGIPNTADLTFQILNCHTCGSAIPDVELDDISISCNNNIDTDGDNIPNRLDLDSDNDGCFDAKESGVSEDKFDASTGKVTGAVGSNGLADDLETVADNGIINYTSTYANAINALFDNCYCTQSPNTAPATIFSISGISTQAKRAGWPEDVANGFLVLESKEKGFVITRLTTSQRDGLTAVEGMLIYNITNTRMELYNGTAWIPLTRSCNE